MSNNRIKEIRTKVRQQKEFFIHFLFWFIGIAGIWKMIYFTEGDMKWFYFALFGWGIVLFVHFLAVIGIPIINKIGQKWEDKEVEHRVISELEAESDELELKEVRKEFRDDEFV